MPRPLPSPVSSGEIALDGRHPGTYVYRAYDKAGDLLYIGISDYLETRIAAHRAGSPWYYQARRIEWAKFATREAAEYVEYRLILDLCPEHNRAGNERREIARVMGHRRIYPSTAWDRLGQVIRDERTARKRPQRAVAGDGLLDIKVLREMEAGETTRYTAEQLGCLEYGMGWVHGPVERILQGGEPERLTSEQRVLRAHLDYDRVMGRGI